LIHLVKSILGAAAFAAFQAFSLQKQHQDDPTRLLPMVITSSSTKSSCFSLLLVAAAAGLAAISSYWRLR
jgi:hypothetical protein